MEEELVSPEEAAMIFGEEEVSPEEAASVFSDAEEAPMEGGEELINERDYTDLGFGELTGKALGNAGSTLWDVGKAAVSAAGSALQTGSDMMLGRGGDASRRMAEGVVNATGMAIENPGATARGIARTAAPIVGGITGGVVGSAAGPVGTGAGAVGGASVAAAGLEGLLALIEENFGVNAQDREFANINSVEGLIKQTAGETIENVALGGAFGLGGKIAKATSNASGSLGRGLVNRSVQLNAKRDGLEAVKNTVRKHVNHKNIRAIDDISDVAVNKILLRGQLLKQDGVLKPVTEEGSVFDVMETILTHEKGGKTLVDEADQALKAVIAQSGKKYKLGDVDSFVNKIPEISKKYDPNTLPSDLAPITREISKPIKVALAKKAGYSLSEADSFLNFKPKRIRQLQKELNSMGSDKTASGYQQASQELKRLEGEVDGFRAKVREAELDPNEFWEAVTRGTGKDWTTVNAAGERNFDVLGNQVNGAFRQAVKDDLRGSFTEGSGLRESYDQLNSEVSSLISLRDFAKASKQSEKALLRDPNSSVAQSLIGGALNKAGTVLGLAQGDTLAAPIKHFMAADRAMSGVKQGAGLSERFYRYIGQGGLPSVDKTLNSVSDFFTVTNSLQFARSVIAAEEWMRMYPEEMQKAGSTIMQGPQRWLSATSKIAQKIAQLEGRPEPEQLAGMAELYADSDARPFLPMDESGGNVFEGVRTIAGGTPLEQVDVDNYFQNLDRAGMSQFEKSKRRRYFNENKKFLFEDVEKKDENDVSIEEAEKKIQMMKAREDMQKFKSSKDVAKYSKMSTFSGPNRGSVQPVSFDTMEDDSFYKAYEVVRASEGGFSDRKSDKGGRTNFGVTQKTYNAYLEGLGEDPRDVKDISEGEVEEIYRSYWSDSGADNLPWPLSAIVFDAAINSGPGRAVMQLQKVLGVKQDGGLGPQTLEALDRANIQTVAMDFLDERESFYRGLNEPENIKGWLNRVKKMRGLTRQQRMDDMGLKIA